MKTYYIRIEGNEDNGFRPIICGYEYRQFKEVVASLEKRGIAYESWVD